MTFYIKQNDTAPGLRATLTDGENQAVDLTGASVRFHMRSIGSNSIIVDSTVYVVPPTTGGIVQYNWAEADTSSIGSYQAEFEVTYSDSSIETFPNNGYIRVEILDDIT
tara:strand:+ start:1028 stop:1354 length:327 start_codon:yes stop_codon:yes gene_type:complete